MMFLITLTILVAVSAALHIRAEYGGPRRNVYIFKPLTMFFIICIALGAEASLPFYKYLIVAGLLCSLAGDIFLMLPSDRFIQGLLSFLFAHLFYIAAFTFGGARRPHFTAAILLLLYGLFMLRLLGPHLGRMRLPVMIYMLVILLMVWQAWNMHEVVGNMASRLTFAGACLFAVSDSVLALDRFRSKFASARLLILITYFTAQYLIALSLKF